MYTKGKVKQYMRDNVAYHVDPKTLEVNATGLAEDAADAWGYVYDTPDDFFDWAAEIADVEEKRLLALWEKEWERAESKPGIVSDIM